MVHRASYFKDGRPGGRPSKAIEVVSVTAACLVALFLFACLMIPVNPLVALEFIAAHS